MTTSTKLRQAAAILNVIPSDKADLILDRLPTRDLRCLVRAMRELDSLAEGQLFEALELFARDITQHANPRLRSHQNWSFAISCFKTNSEIVIALPALWVV